MLSHNPRAQPGLGDNDDDDDAEPMVRASSLHDDSSGVDVTDEEDDDEDMNCMALSAQQRALERVRHVEPEEASELYALMYGSEEEAQRLNDRLADYTRQDWATLAEGLLNNKIDTSCADRDLAVTFRFFHQLFCYPFTDQYSVIDRVQALYPNVLTIQEQFQKIQHTFKVLHLCFVQRGMINDDTRSGKELQTMITQISFGMKLTYESVLTNRMLQNAHDQSTRTILENMSPMTFLHGYKLTKLKKQVQLLHFYYDRAFRKSYRKDGDCIYRPRKNKHGEFVYAYEYVYDVSDFVYQEVFPIEQNHYWFECLTEKFSNARQCIQTLTNLKSEWLPELKRNPQVHSFQNGLFVIPENKFYFFRPREGYYHISQLKGNLVAVKYHDMIFDVDGMREDMEQAPSNHYLAIKMPSINQIFDTQEFTLEERHWVLALLGRMLHPLGELDTWGVFPYFLGLAGTGKSTCLRLLARLLEARDVGYLNNSLQKTFALEGVYDKLLYLALDVDESFQLDQATFQSMVVGEEVAVLRKFKQPLTKVWNIHGAFAGNKLPAWNDNGGSLNRRLVVIEFLKVVTKCDPNLFEKCVGEIDRFLKVIVSAYQRLAELHNGRGIKEVIPEKFRKAGKKALIQLNSLSAFLHECCDLDPETDKTVVQPFKQFQNAFRQYCRENQIPSLTLNYTNYCGVFAKHQIEVIDPKRGAADRFHQTARYILGLKLKQNIIDGLNNPG